MSRYERSFVRMFLGLLLVVSSGLLPLRAQLDTRLQTSTTDFLELYQASTNVKVKPEILTIFDFSGSMAALMFHPLFVNTDVTDSGNVDDTYFELLPGMAAGTYNVTATSVLNANAHASVDLTADASGNITSSNAVTSAAHTTDPSGVLNNYWYTSTSVPTVTGTKDSVTVTVTVYIYNNRTYSRNANVGVNWTTNGGTLSSATSGATVSIPGKTLYTRVSTTTWHFNSASAVKVTAKGTSTGVGTLTSQQLVKPDGTLVTATDANAATSGSLPGCSFGQNDVRNWVRAASHVRFSYTDGTTLRTVDYPIPWKITNRNSTGNPLSSQTVLDSVTTGGKTYGSGNQIEMDQSYSTCFSSNSTTQQTAVSLASVWNKGWYFDWIFKGKYSNGPYVGKYIVYDAADATLAGGQGNVNWGKGYGPQVAPWGQTITIPDYNLDGTYKGTDVTVDASKMMLPSLTRVQANKRAVIQTWIRFQADVFWAFRFLAPGTIESASGNTINNNSATTSGSSGWKLFNGSSEANMNYIAKRSAGDSTPLTYAVSRGLAQFTDPNSIFNSVEVDTATDKNAPSQCMNHFLILFTDGLDNNGTGTNNTNGNTPYLVVKNGKTGIYAADGNKTILADPTGSIDRTGTYWNLFTFMGVAAHMADSSLGIVNVDYMAATAPAAGVTSGSPSSFLPYALKKRNGVTFDKDHRITSMTVGVSLGGQYTDATSPKRSMFLGAALGDPLLTTAEDLAQVTPFEWVADPNDPTSYPEVGKKKDKSIYFFDGSDPDRLSDCLKRAIQSAIGASNINATATPNLPFVGASLGKQLYIGKFQPPKTGGAIWPGDLLMFGTREKAGETLIIDNKADEASILNSDTALWSASKSMSSRLWSSRKLWTRLPSTSDTEPGLKEFSDNGVTYTDDTTGLKNYIGTSASPALTAAEKRRVVQKAMGGDTINGPFDTDDRPTVNRSNIMGDIINSAPAAVEYKWDDVKNNLTSKLSAVGGNRFRLILVGTNQGWLHAFGEVTKVSKVTDTAGVEQDLITGAVDELWSFMPTDFLAGLDQMFGGGTKVNNPHRFMVDGTPTIYHLDLPPSAGGYGNGVVDSTERAIALIGLRKGGRSYYALDIHDPFTPALKWSLVPDEAANFPSARIITKGPSIDTVKAVLSRMGYSSSTPAIGRVTLDKVLHDAVFLGGGFSTPEVDAQYPSSLGRSAMALDVYSGKVLAACDLTDTKIGGSAVGPVGAGVIPFEFVLNSGMAQRAYFLDYTGSLWAWGKSKDVYTSNPYKDFRQDTAEVADWDVRRVYKDANNADSGYGGRYTTLPAPFRLGTFPGVGKTGSDSPAAVGIAMVSGDRNNPLDYKYNTTSNLAPDHHRLTVVFDRQDSRAWGLDEAPGDGPDTGIQDSDLLDATGFDVSTTPADRCADSVFKYITPGCESYYLAPHSGTPAVYGTPKFGYFIDFPSISTKNFIPKGVNPPLVVAGSLFYSYFDPTNADPCTGGAGQTLSWLTCDVINPLRKDTRSGFTCLSGQTDTWAGLASDFIAIGTRGVIQGGAASVSNPAPGSSLTTPEIHRTQGTPSQRFPKTRVWRTVH